MKLDSPFLRCRPKWDGGLYEVAALIPSSPRRSPGRSPPAARTPPPQPSPGGRGGIGDGRPLVPRVVRLFRPYRVWVAVVVLLVVTTACLGVVNPVLVKYVFDNGLFPEGGPNVRVLWILAGVMAVVAAGSAVVGIFQTYMTNKVGTCATPCTPTCRGCRCASSLAPAPERFSLA